MQIRPELRGFWFRFIWRGAYGVKPLHEERLAKSPRMRRPVTEQRLTFTFCSTALALLAYCTASACADGSPDLLTVPADLQNPIITDASPSPGKMVLQALPAYAGTEVAHALYLPTDWMPEQRFPVIIEYQGNTRRVRDGGGLGYGLSGGKGFIWAVLPYVGRDRKADTNWWWGDVAATIAYAKEAVPAICRQWGGDSSRVILVGHSRGAVACNYIGLHDEEIARLWRAMLPLSHYDDEHTAWGMTPQEQAGAPERLRRLGNIPQFVCGEYTSRLPRGSAANLLAAVAEKHLGTFAEAKQALGLVPLTDAEGTRPFLATNHPQARMTILDLPYVNHTAEVVLRDVPERRRMREWLQSVSRADATAKPMLFAAYYCWYRAATNAHDPWRHWTYPASATNAAAQQDRRDGEPPLATAARPLAGFYDSADPHVAE